MITLTILFLSLIGLIIHILLTPVRIVLGIILLPIALVVLFLIYLLPMLMSGEFSSYLVLPLMLLAL